MLTFTAISLRKTADSVGTPYSVKTYGFTEECFNDSNRGYYGSISASHFGRIVPAITVQNVPF